MVHPVLQFRHGNAHTLENTVHICAQIPSIFRRYFMGEIKLIPGGQQDQTPVSAQNSLKNPWVFFQEYRQDTEPGGTTTYYDVFPGVILFQNRIHTDSCEEIREKANALAINFCANGRLESQFSENDLGIVEPGDVAVSLYDGEHGTRSITDIALDASFSSASKFGESFKKRYGVTPTEYRLQFRDRNGIIESNRNI